VDGTARRIPWYRNGLGRYNGNMDTAGGTPGPAMAGDGTFAHFLNRVRAGDEQAAAELVRRYESAVRVEGRRPLADSPLRRLLDWMDICQSVLASFFLRAAAGQYDLERPEQLVRLLVTIARNKVAYQARRQQARRRDQRRDVEADRPGHEPAGTDPSPSRF